MGKREIWTEKEIIFLKNNYLTMSYAQIANELNRSVSSVASKIRKLKLFKDNKSQIRYSYNKNYFKSIDTYDKAYWLGFISADGCIADHGKGTYRLKITLQNDDYNHLVKFNRALNSNVPIKNKEVKYNNKIFCVSELVINCSSMCKDLMNYGIMPNKSLSIDLPKIDDKFFIAYLRGLFDGDGTYYLGKRETGTYRYSVELVSGSIVLLEKIVDILKSRYNIVSNIYKARDTKYKLYICNKKHILNLFHLFYHDNQCICLDRKKKKAMEIMNVLAV